MKDDEFEFFRAFEEGSKKGFFIYGYNVKKEIGEKIADFVDS